MPELPEVLTVVECLKQDGIIGQRFNGKKLKNIERCGKYILFTFDTTFFLVHLGMTGHLEVTSKPRKYERFRLKFENGKELVFSDARKFGKFNFYPKFPEILNKLGVEPLTAKVRDIEKILKSKARIKGLLLNQRKIAGIGNIYADEALFEAKIDPRTEARRVDPKTLLKAIKKVLKLGIKNRGTSLGKKSINFYDSHGSFGQNGKNLKVYGKKFCFKCKGPIQKIVINQRSSSFCPKCQKTLI